EVGDAIAARCDILQIYHGGPARLQYYIPCIGTETYLVGGNGISPTSPLTRQIIFQHICPRLTVSEYLAVTACGQGRNRIILCRHALPLIGAYVTGTTRVAGLATHVGGTASGR